MIKSPNVMTTLNDMNNNADLCYDNYCLAPKSVNLVIALLNIFLLFFVFSVQASESNFDQIPWTEGSTLHVGANTKYANYSARVKWQQEGGDWCDKEGKYRGSNFYVNAPVEDGQVILDLSLLFTEYQNKNFVYGDVILKTNVGSIKVASKEAAKTLSQPYIYFKKHEEVEFLIPEEDTYTHPSTTRSLGSRKFISIDNKNLALFRFKVPSSEQDRADLHLTITGSISKDAQIEVYRSCYQPKHNQKVFKGIAAKFPLDKGIQNSKNVILFENFESRGKLHNSWTFGAKQQSLELTDQSKKYFYPMDNTALKATITKGSNAGLDLAYEFRKQNREEPEELYFRYYVQFANNWNPRDGGKLPGLTGTYNKAGWGGRKPNGFNGWSSRGLYLKTLSQHPLLSNKVPVGNYVYHVNQTSEYGDHIIWKEGYKGYLEKNKWYCLEQYVKLNDIGKKNGQLKAWVDGKIALNIDNLEYRKSNDLKIEKVWLNVYHGGKITAGQDISLYIDNVVIADKYIGPIEPLY